IELPQTVLHGRPQNGIQAVFILELHLGLGGMYVDVQARGIHLQIKKIAGMDVPLDQPLNGGDHRMVQVRAPYKALVDKKELLPPALFGEFRFADKAGDPHQLRLFPDRYQAAVHAMAKDMDDPLPRFGRGQVEHLRGIVVETEAHGWVDQGDPLELIDDMAELHRVRLQEIPSGWDIEKKVLDRNGSALGGGHRGL